jgi:enoyl-CoA hydratase
MPDSRKGSVIVRRNGTVAIVTINRQSKMNAIDERVMNGMKIALEKVGAERLVRSVVITGAGDKAFSAGADIEYLASIENTRQAARFVYAIHRLYDAIENFEKPTIAAINGFCLGGGLEMALACDIRVGSLNSKFGFPEAGLGLVPGGGGTFRLPGIVGVGKAKEMIFGAGIIDSNEAFRIMLINRLSENVVKDSVELAAKIGSNSSNAVKNSKRAINSAIRMKEETEREMFISAFGHGDAKEGLDAFIKHRKPRFV